MVFGIDAFLAVDLRQFGLRPREIEGLIGIITYPLLHGDWKHITDNSVSGFVLTFGLFSFYGQVGWRVLGWSWLMSAVWIWIAARNGNHIGFSGIIYAVASFVFFSGVIRRYYRLMALSLVVVFLYGSMIWGVLPIKPGISWEGHLFGGVAGFILAFLFREDGPKRPKYSWELEEEIEEGNEVLDIDFEEMPNPENKKPQPKGTGSAFNYIYREKPDK
ncbi:MAG: rhomboid family intramembrane serine protease [Salibacteraceae bacterium]